MAIVVSAAVLVFYISLTASGTIVSQASGKDAVIDIAEESAEEKKGFSEEPATEYLGREAKGQKIAYGWAYTVSNGSVTINHYEGTETEAVIPETIEGLPVTELGYYIFKGAVPVVKLTIPKTVQSVSCVTFRFADSLETIEVASSSKYLSSIKGVLLTADKKELVAYPPGKKTTDYKIPSGVVEIRQNGFAYADNLESLTFADSVQIIGDTAFTDCSTLTKIKLNKNLIMISDRAFMFCDALKSIYIPENVRLISPLNNAFDACLGLESITVAPANKSYVSKDGVLFDKDKRTLICYPSGKKDKSYTIPKTVKTVKHMDNNYYLQELIMQKGIKTIETEALKHNTALERVVFSSTVEKIFNDAFCGCSSLAAVKLPKSVSVVSNGAFSSCTSLKKITFKNPNCYICPFDSTISTQAVICGTEKSSAFQYAKSFGRTFQNMDTLEKEVFHRDNRTLFALLPKSEVSFGEQAVQGITTWKDGVFMGYQTAIIHEEDEKNPYYIELKNKVQELTKNCSNDIQKVETISGWVSDHMTYVYGQMSGNTIDSVYSIYKNPFGNCMCYTMLTNYMLYLAEIPTVDITSIGHEWGAAYVNGEWINVDSTNRLIGEDVSFYPDIQTISFSSGRMVFTVNNCEGVYLAGIGYDYLDKKNVKEITIPSYVAGIYGNVFEDVSPELLVHGKKGTYAEKYVKKNFKYMVYDGDMFTASNQRLQNELSEGENWTDGKSKDTYKITKPGSKGGTAEYSKCSASSSATVTIPAKISINGISYRVTSVGRNAFKGNKHIRKIRIGKNVKEIKANAFSGCAKLGEVQLPDKLESIGEKVFYKCTSLKKITIPKKVEKIGKQAFFGDYKLKEITVKTLKLTSKTLGKGAFTGIAKQAVITLPEKKYGAYKKLFKSKGTASGIRYKKAIQKK